MPHDATPTAWTRRLATAHLTLALLTVVGTLVVVWWTWRQPTANNIDTLRFAAWYAVAATLIYLATATTAMLVWYRRWQRGDSPVAPPERWKWRAALTSAIVAVAWAAISGTDSRAWLAGLDPLLVAAVVASLLALVFEIVASCTCAANANDSTPSDEVSAWVSRGALLAALAMLASLVYLESRPLPHALPSPQSTVEQSSARAQSQVVHEANP